MPGRFLFFFTRAAGGILGAAHLHRTHGVQILGVARVVRHDDHRAPAAAFVDEPDDLFPRALVEPLERLVEQDRVALRQHRADDRHAARHAARKLETALFAVRIVKADRTKRRRGLRLRAARRHGDIPRRAEERQEPVLLKNGTRPLEAGKHPGIRPEQAVNRFLGGLPRRFEPAPGPCKLESVLFSIDTDQRRCVSVERVDIRA